MRVEIRNKILDIDSDYTQQIQAFSGSKLIRPFAILLAHSGDSWFWITGLVIVWWFGSEFWKVRAAWMIFGIIFTAFLVMILKFSIRRKRPEGAWGNIYRKSDPHSFPSGHAARAALLACLAAGFGPQWFSLFMLVWAPLVILARVVMGLHYLSDVIAGGLIGIFIGILLLQIYPQLPFLI